MKSRTNLFNPGPPSSPRGFTFYGHFSRGAAVARFRIKRLHDQANLENAARAAVKGHE